MKLEFTYFPFPRIERGPEHYGITTDSLTDIAVNKLFSVYQRTKARDYIDLYFICRRENFTIQDLIVKARAKFDFHIDLLQLGTKFSRAAQATDYPRMITKVTDSEWQDFFKDEG